MGRFLILAAAMLIGGCASAPKAHEFEKSFPYARTYDDVWAAVIETFAELNLPIANVEKDSGIITTDWLDMEGSDAFYDCGGHGIFTVESTQGKFNVFVKRNAETTGASVLVNTSFRQLRSFGSDQSWTQCTSTGSLENKINGKISKKLIAP